MTVRPLLSYRIDQLEDMLKTFTSHEASLQKLEHELEFRQTPRARDLLEKVQRRLNGLEAVGKAVEAGQLGLQLESVKPPSRPPEAAPERHASQPRCAVPSMGASPSLELKNAVGTDAVPLMPMDVACKRLGVSLNASWEKIEMRRREVVDQARPDKVAAMTPEQRSSRQSQAAQANQAAAALRKAAGW